MSEISYEWAWSNFVIDDLIKALDLPANVMRLCFVFETGQYPVLLFTSDDGESAKRIFDWQATKEIGGILGLPGACRSAHITVEREYFVRIEAEFMPPRNPLHEMIDLLTQRKENA